MFSYSLLAAPAFVLLLGAASVQAHGELMLPRPTYPKWGGSVTATISPSALPFPWRQDYPQAFSEAFKAHGGSLKDFIIKNQNMTGATESGSSPDCGYANPNGTPQPLPDQIQFHTGFIHWGPCEAYCDDELVAPYTVDCRASYPTGAVPYNKAKCAGKKRFTFYWLTMDGSPWQVYVNCVPLQTSGAAANDDDSGSDADADADVDTTPAPTTALPKPSTPSSTTKPTKSPASASPSKTSAPVTPAKTPSPVTTTAPSAATSAPTPSATKKACTKVKRRN